LRQEGRSEIDEREMNILSTSISIDKDKAQRVVLKSRQGLIDWVALFFQKSSRGQERILSSQLIYYPHWLVGAEVKFSCPVSNPRILYAFLGVDGHCGSVSRAVGYPETEEILVDGSQVVRCLVTEEEARSVSIRFLQSTYGFKYKKIPEINPLEIQRVYKPNLIFSCQKGAREYFRAVDAETGVRNYMLDIKFRELSYCDDDRLIGPLV